MYHNGMLTKETATPKVTEPITKDGLKLYLIAKIDANIIVDRALSIIET